MDHRETGTDGEGLTGSCAGAKCSSDMLNPVKAVRPQPETAYWVGGGAVAIARLFRRFATLAGRSAFVACPLLHENAHQT